MPTLYEEDIVAWANEQAKFIRRGQFNLLDREHIADEIEDVGKSERRELESRLAVLMAHLLKWQFQPERRGASWQRTIWLQRREVDYVLRKEAPSLRAKFEDSIWMDLVWNKALTQAVSETGLDIFPEACPWPLEDILSDTFYPEPEIKDSSS